jgi:hypothetical protein
MADYRIKAQKTGPRTFKKELQMISYRGSALYSDEGNTLLSERDVYYPPEYLSKGAVAVVIDAESFKLDGLSKLNKFSKGRTAALPVEEVFQEESAVSRSLLGINRSETQQGLFDDVSSYGLDRKDWIVYGGYPDVGLGIEWERKNSPAGPHNPIIDKDYAEGAAVIESSYPVPYINPSNAPLDARLRGIAGAVGPGWGRYLQSLAAMYIIEYMVNNFTPQEKLAFKLDFLERKYPKTADGKFDRLYWDQIWLDVDQGRFETSANIPIIPSGRLVNFTFEEGQNSIDLTQSFGSTLSIDDKDVDVSYDGVFFSTTRYTWIEPNQGHYRIATNPNEEVWREYWGIEYDSLPQELKDWEFGVYENDGDVPLFVKEYKLPYFLIQSKVPSRSLIFSSAWPQRFSDPSVPQIGGSIADGNLIGARESNYSVITLTSARAFRYQPGRISGFTYGVRVSEEGAGPGSVLEWGIENFTDGYFFRLADGTDFSVVRRSIVPLGQTELFTIAGYEEREAYIEQTTGVVKYKDKLTTSEVLQIEEEVAEGRVVKVFETVIQQNLMNGDGLNSQGESGYIFNPDTVTMYKIEFGWYGAIGARFYAYIPQGNAESRWVVLHTLVIENQLNQPCLADPFFYFKYRVYIDSPSRIRLPQFVEKYGASYYIDGGDEGTVSISSGKATNRTLPPISSNDIEMETYNWASVLGIKPKQFIVNTEGNSFKSKKEIFPVSISITSTVPSEIKLVNQFGCRENGFTFQEGYRCELPESQRIRGLFAVNSLQESESNLISLGRDADSPVPTLIYVGGDPDFLSASANLQEEGGAFIGWNAYNNGLHGSHVIADKVYSAYINPTQEGVESPTGFSGNEIVLQRSTSNTPFYGLPSDRAWSDTELIFRYQDTISAKLSQFRRDTTLLSTVDISSNEFYLLFSKDVSKNSGLDAYVFPSNCFEDGDSIGCDGRHFGDFQIGLVWPTETPATYTYPQSIISRARVGKSFGIIDPKNANDQTLSNSEVEVDQQSGNYFVIDKQIPNSDTYRYYEGLPINFASKELENNVLLLNQFGWTTISPQGLEISEGIERDPLGLIDYQLPRIPGMEGGECHAIYGKAGELQQLATFTNEGSDGAVVAGRFYLSSLNSWPEDLWLSANTLFVEEEETNESIVVSTISGEKQQTFTPEGTNIRLYLLPVTIVSGSAYSNGTRVTAKYKAIALYSTSLNKVADRLLVQKIVGQNLFPLRFFIRMREGSRIGGVTVGQVTSNGIVQTPFTPHGCTLSVNNVDGLADIHDAGSGDNVSAAKKSMIVFTEPGTLTSANYSYYDTTGVSEVDRTKKCPSFISDELLSGAGFSGSGDYPIRWLEFKESGDPVASYYISANQPTEISLTDIFSINTESVGPNFWGNKALFMIARSLQEGVGGKMSVTFNYKEQ